MLHYLFRPARLRTCFLLRFSTKFYPLIDLPTADASGELKMVRSIRLLAHLHFIISGVRSDVSNLSFQFPRTRHRVARPILLLTNDPM